MVILFISHVHLLREATLAVLDGADGIEAFGAFSRDTAEAVALKVMPSVVIIDVSHPEAAALVGAVQACVAKVRVVVLATRERDEDFLAWAEIGMFGYLGPDTSARDLFSAVRRVEAGEVVCPPRLTALLMSRWADRSSGGLMRAGIHALTSREREVAALLADGLSNKLIARRLRVAVSTVKNHIHSILDKWNVGSRGEAAARFRQKALEGELCLPYPARSLPGPTVRAWSDARAPSILQGTRPAPRPISP